MTAHLTRRALLRRGAQTALLLAGGAALTACGLAPAGTAAPAGAARPAPAPGQPNPSFVPDVEIRLRAAPAEAPILTGRPTQVWGYQAELLTGDPGSLQLLPGSYLGPTIRVRRGQKVRVHFSHELPGRDTRSIVNWHGLTLPSEQDAHPRHAVAAGQTYVYEFTVADRAGTY